MSKKDPEKQRRRKKLEEKKRLARRPQALAYLGEKYKKSEFVPTWMETEIAIYEAYVMSDRTLSDRKVASALGRLIVELRKGTLPPVAENAELDYETGREEELVVQNIRRRWQDHFTTKWRPSRDDLIGILRSILGSIERVKSPDPKSQSYLHFIAGFLTKKLGVSIRKVSADRRPLPEPDEDELVALGRRWHAGADPEARAEFFQLAAHLMSSGQTSRVTDACHLLVGEISDPKSETVNELLNLIASARGSLITAAK